MEPLGIALILIVLAIVCGVVTFPEQVSQYMGLMTVNTLTPQNYAVNTNNNINGWIAGVLNMSIYRRAFGVVDIGVIVGANAAGNTVNISFLAGNTSNTLCTNFANSTVWTWNTIASGPTLSITNSNQIATIEMRADQMPSGKNYLALLVNNVQAAFFDGILFGADCCYSPGGIGNLNQLNTVQGLQQAIM